MGGVLATSNTGRKAVGLQHMTSRAFHGPRFELLVASDALLMERIGPFWKVLVIAFGLMAVATGLDVFNFAHFQCMVTIGAGNTIAVCRPMGFMIEQNFSSGAFEHDPDRVVWDFGRKGGIAKNTDNQKNDCQPVCPLQPLI